MKKLIPAICLLLIAACLMGTSTYAWFSLGKTASVEGMKVKAKAEGGLAVATYTFDTDNKTAKAPANSTDYSSSVTAVWNNQANTTAASALTLVPTSYDSKNKKWYTAGSDDIGSSVVNSDGYSEILSTNEHLYFLQTKYSVKTLADETGSQYLYLKDVTITGALESTNLNKALRIMIKVGTKYTTIAPYYATASDGGLYHYWKNVSTNSSDAYDNPAATTSPDVKIYDTAMSASSSVDVDVYIYYEGEDANCTSLNAAKVDTLTVSLTFAAKNS